ncbi:ABC transporter permease [Bradymonas sediminis]|uniref:ABC transporter permease n=1 Tax=Bradymonas sediminis TaxID=1548548 RepID=UPI0010DFAA7D|nr:ABC transporter permease [Bradymonas sediminis]TDP62634.1 ABC-2 type transport system permease protein [Bradymonas sediminis]
MSPAPKPQEDSPTRPVGAPPAAAERAARARIAELTVVAQSQGWFGAWTLFRKEIHRFWNVASQTIVSPVVTTMLYFLVFGYSLGGRLKEVEGVPYIDFLVPGLVMLSLINNAFVNSAFSFFINKIHGTIVDILVTPLTHLQLMAGYTGASIMRAMLVGSIIWAVAMLMGADQVVATLTGPNALLHILITLSFMLLTSLAFALVGLTTAIVAEDFDHINLLPTFLLTPLTFLGGVFYSITMLPAPWDMVSRFNPILYMVNGIRYGMTGISDVPLWQGYLVVIALDLTFAAIAWWLLSSGKTIRE